MRRAAVRQSSRSSDAVPRAGKRRSGKLDPRFAEYRRTHDHDLRNELIEAHRWLAVHCARRFAHKGEPMDDLEQVAVVGLLRAVERFDPSVGAMFSTFAVPTIIGELRRHFRDKTWAVHVPRGAKENYQILNNVVGELVPMLGRSPTMSEIAEFANVTVEEALEALEVGECYRGMPLESPSEDDSQSTSHHRCDVVPMGGPDPGYEAAEMKVIVQDLLDEVDDERDRQILRLRFFDSMTQSQIAAKVGVSQVQVSRLLRTNLQQLRNCVD